MIGTQYAHCGLCISAETLHRSRAVGVLCLKPWYTEGSLQATCIHNHRTRLRRPSFSRTEASAYPKTSRATKQRVIEFPADIMSGTLKLRQSLLLDTASCTFSGMSTVAAAACFASLQKFDSAWVEVKHGVSGCCERKICFDRAKLGRVQKSRPQFRLHRAA